MQASYTNMVKLMCVICQDSIVVSCAVVRIGMRNIYHSLRFESYHSSVNPLVILGLPAVTNTYINYTLQKGVLKFIFEFLDHKG